MIFKHIFHQKRKLDQLQLRQSPNNASATTSLYKSSTGTDTSVADFEKSTRTAELHGHHGGQRILAALSTMTFASRTSPLARIDTDKPLPELPASKTDTEPSDFGDNEDGDNPKKPRTVTPGLTSRSSKSSDAPSSEDHQGDIAKDISISINAVLEKLTESDREVIIRAFNSTGMDLFGGHERTEKTSMSPSSMIGEEEMSKRMDPRRLKHCTRGHRGGNDTASDTASVPDLACPPSPPALTAEFGRGECKDGTDDTKSSQIGGSEMEEVKTLPQDIRQRRKNDLEEHILRQMHARQQGKMQWQTLGTRVLKTKERPSAAVDMEWDFWPPTSLALDCKTASFSKSTHSGESQEILKLRRYTRGHDCSRGAPGLSNDCSLS